MSKLIFIIQILIQKNHDDKYNQGFKTYHEEVLVSEFVEDEEVTFSYTAIKEEFHDHYDNQVAILVLGYREDLGFIPLNSHQQKTHSVGPFGNNLRTSCSLTRNSYGEPQNQVSAGKRGILLYL